jgi:rare lipoprotein A
MNVGLFGDGMVDYQIRKGDSIEKVTRLLGMSWDEFRQLNPNAVSHSGKTGRWYIKEGASVSNSKSFQETLATAQEATKEKSSPAKQGETEKNQWISYTVKRGDTLSLLAEKKFQVPIEDIMRDNGLQNASQLYVGQKLKIEVPSYHGKQAITASWYGKNHQGKTMANGQPFNMNAATLAHRYLPFGTRVELENPGTGQVAKATVTDRGPFVAGRDVDLSYGLAKKLSIVEKGVSKLLMRVI